ncbi:MAG TPA: APC family permease [Spirochaetota bacterium]|nr:APC family permease [Spirochaetota bacterium]HPV39532.1 APC family permease [Spirochaetota bacterium]
MTDDNSRPSLYHRLRKLVVGDARSISDPGIFHKLSLIAFFAWVGLGADGLTSSCYGPEEAFLALGRHPHLSIFVALGTVITIFVISASYHQIIELFPTGGGGYLVASKLISPSVGMVAGSALLIDYLLTITLSVASGADALFSFLPAYMLPYKLPVAVWGVSLLIILNLRGVKESVLPLVPIFLIFIVTHAFAIIYTFASQAGNIPVLVNATATEISASSSELGFAGMIFLILRAYSMGAGTFTGIEAVSNGMSILREPKVQTAKRTMNYMATSLALVVAGLMISYLLLGVHHVRGKTLNAVLFDSMTAGWGSAGVIFVLVTLLSEAVLLFVAAQTGFLGGPAILANMALDRWAPGRFASLNDRLVTQNGILIMGIGSIVLMIYSGGSVKFLVILYSINVFVTFSLSQLGMVRHWWQSRSKFPHWRKKLMINGIGLVLTSFILVTVVVLKFNEGGWITIFITGSLVFLAVIIRRHYNKTRKLLRRLNGLVEVAEAEMKNIEIKQGNGEKTAAKIQCNPKDKTAVLFVNGFTGTGLHTLFNIVRLFQGMYRNFVFVQIGLVDSGVFKGTEELSALRTHIQKDCERYVEYMRAHGRYAESVTSIAVDVIEETVQLAPKILERFPNAIFFAGQLVFPEDTFFTRWLHNYSAFAIQRRFYHRGIPIVILPIRV